MKRLILLIFFLTLTLSGCKIQTPDQHFSAGSIDAAGAVSLRIDATRAGYDFPVLPDGGQLLEWTVPLAAGDTAWTLLDRAAREYGLTVVHTGSGASCYVSGIGGLFEFDRGPLSGWIYKVNGEQLSISCGEAVLRDGDILEWIYSL